MADLRLLVPGTSSDIRTQFDLLCQSLGMDVRPWAEVDDMAMLRLLARDSGGAAVVPEVVVQDELRGGLLQKYCEIPEVFEEFHAITARQRMGDFVEDGIHNVFDIPQIEVGIAFSDALDEFRLDHFWPPKITANKVQN